MLECSMGNLQVSKTMQTHQNNLLLSKINEFRSTGKLCDVIFVVDKKQFPAHKAVLAGFNPYFESLFTGGFRESHQEEIQLDSFDVSIMEILLDYIYIGAIEITYDNVQALFDAANFLQDKSLLLLCTDYLEKNLNTESCFDILNISQEYEREVLQQKAKQFILENFSNVSSEVGFLELGAEKLINFISDSALRADKEEHVFDAVLQWFHYKPEERESLLPDVIKHVRLTSLDPYFLHTRLNTTDALLKSESCMKLFLDVFSYHTLPNRRNELRQPSTFRKCDTTTAVQVLLITGQSNQHLKQPKQHLCVTDNGEVVRTLCLPPTCDMSTLSTTSSNELFYVDEESRKVKVFSVGLGGWQILDTFTVPVGRALLNLDGRWYAFGLSESQGDIHIQWLDKTSPPSWKTLRPMPELVHNPAVVSVDGMVYLVGGKTTNGTRSARIQRFDPFTETWSLVSVLPAPWKSLKACALNGLIFVYNSRDDSEYESWQLDAYNVRTNQWKACSKMRLQFKDHIVLKTVPFHGKIYVLVEKNSNIDIVVYSPTIDLWSDCPALSQPDFKVTTFRGPIIIEHMPLN